MNRNKTKCGHWWQWSVISWTDRGGMQTVNFNLSHQVWSEVKWQITNLIRFSFLAVVQKRWGLFQKSTRGSCWQWLQIRSQMRKLRSSMEKHLVMKRGCQLQEAPAHLYPTLLHFRRHFTDCAAQLPSRFSSLVFECIYFKPFCHFVLQMKIRFWNIFKETE